MKPHAIFSLGIFALMACADALADGAAAGVPQGAKPTPPGQPQTGPGGSDYPHRSVRETEHGEGGRQFWIIEPAQPAPKSAPLIIFIHGWSAMTPDTYRGWIDHLAQRGNIVVYPRYQERLLSPAREFFPNVIASVRAALDVLKQPGRVAPDLERVALVGHSVGGAQVVNYAVAGAEGLPVAKAVMIVQPGPGTNNGIKIIPMEGCGKFPAALKLVVMVGDADGIVGEGAARAIWRGTKHVSDRAFVTLRSDTRGSPPLNANHIAPISWDRAATDALDCLGMWRTFDSLMDSAFTNKPLVVDASMGAWSDGVPVTPMKVER